MSRLKRRSEEFRVFIDGAKAPPPAEYFPWSSSVQGFGNR